MSVKNLPKLKVSLKFKRLSDPALFSFSKSSTFNGDPDATNPPYSDNDIYFYADDFMAALTSMKTNPSVAATTLKNWKRNILIDALDDNARYLQSIANKVSRANGDADKGRTVVFRIGFNLSGQGGFNRFPGVVDVGIGWVHVREIKSKKGNEGHIWEAGLTDTKYISPTKSYMWNSLEAEGIFYNLPSGTVFAYRHASIVPVSHSNKAGSQTVSHSAAAKTASLIPMSKGKHPALNFTNPNNYQFSEWRYIVIP